MLYNKNNYFMKLNLKDKILLLSFFFVVLTSLWANNIYLLFVFSILCCFLIPLNKWWDNVTMYLLIFSLFYAMMVVLNGRNNSYFNLLSYIIAPVTFYRFGRWTMNIFRDDVARQNFIFITILLYLGYFFVLTLKDIAIVGIVNETRALLGDIDDFESWSATLYGMMASVGISCIAVMFIRKQKLWLKLCFISVSILSLLSVIHLVNRTGIIIFLSCIFISFVVYTKFNLKKMIGASLLLTFIVIVVYTSNIIDQNILDAYAQREESSTFNASQLGGRSERWEVAINNLFTHPLGWDDSGGYAHNLWLDIARVGGLLPLFPFLVATLLHIKNLLYIIMKKSYSNFAIILISINTAMILSSFVEPVIEGSLLFFCMLMMIWGVTKSLVMDKS